MLAGGTGRAATRGGGPVIEMECGITVYPAREEQGRWRAVWHENGERQQCEAASEDKLTAKLAKVTERLEADAPNMTLRGADLIAFYLSPDRLPAQRQWSRKHAHTQRRLCERFAAPVIDTVICQDITTRHMQPSTAPAPRPNSYARPRRGTGQRFTQPPSAPAFPAPTSGETLFGLRCWRCPVGRSGGPINDGHRRF